MQIEVILTKNEIIFELKDFKVITSRDYIEKVNNIEWYGNCIMIDTEDGVESIGLEHLLFGEDVHNPTTYARLEGIESISREELRETLEKIDSIRWREDETYNDSSE